VPNPFGQNLYQIVQTPDRVVIYVERVHDARVIRLNGTHLPPEVRQWTRDSMGHGDGDTLGAGYAPRPGDRRGPGHAGRAVDRRDPVKATSQIFEYACHEGSHTVEYVMRGARDEERRGVKPNR